MERNSAVPLYQGEKWTYWHVRRLHLFKHRPWAANRHRSDTQFPTNERFRVSSFEIAK